MISSISSFAQKSITGKIVDEKGEPLVGVTVIVKGTTEGATSDVDGKYAVTAKEGSILAFSCIGYLSKEVKVASLKEINLVLVEDNKTLNEVVVVGYGSMTRKDVTSSITTVKADKLNTGVYTDPGQLLQGKVPGLTIVQSSDPTSGTTSISLRGASSFRTGVAMEPYYVIDGIPGMSLNLISPEDIESIDVLRDASATAIYGSKAANGVIVITTKKGSKTDRSSVSYSGYAGFDNIAKRLEMMSASDLRAYASDNNITLPNDEGYNTNWNDEVLRTAVSHNHNVSINGGSERSSYNASFGYLNKEGIVRGTEFERISGRAYMQTKCLNDRLTLALSVNTAQSKGKNVSSNKDGQSVFDAMNYYSPLLPTKNEDGTWYNYTLANQYFNPLSMINEDTYETNKKVLQGTGKATLQINKDLIWNLNLSYGNEQVSYNNYNTTKSQIVTKKGQAYRGTLENKKKVLETYFNYDRTFANAHKIGLMGGYSYEQTDNNDGFGLSVYDFYSDATLYYNLSYANKMDISDITTYPLETLRMISFYGRLNYSYNSKYMFQATVRRDGSSAFGSNHRWGTFPSLSLAWRMSEEKFIKDLNLFDDLKFRVGYGVSGNSLGFGPFQAIQTYGPSGWFTYTDENGNSVLYHTIAAQSNANHDLKWERTSMLNLGFDFTFFGGRLGGTIEYYDKRTSDLIYSYDVPTNRYPYSTMYANVGDINNKGVEFTINATPISTKKFTWETSLNLSHNKNNVKSISNSKYSVDHISAGDPEIAGYSSNAQVERIMEGHPLGTFYTYEWAGYNSDGVSVFYKHNAETGERTGETTKDPVDTDRTITGCAQPKLNLGWTNNFSYKKWSLEMFFTGVFGNKIYNATREQYSNVSFVTEGRNVLKSVATEQKATDVQSQAPSDRWLEKGDYFRLSTLSLGYSFGKLGNWANSLKVYATCNNLFTITGYSGRDPEINLGGLEPGIDRRTNYYPRTRTLMLGVNVNF
jgi:iron complex outermembrane receptor protein